MLKIHDDKGENGYYDISYTINTSGYTMPWMLDNAAYDEDGADTPNKAANYTVPVTMTTKDWGLSFNRSGAKLNVLDDYKYVSVEFPADPYVYKGKANKINDDGTFGAKNIYDGTFTYTKDSERANWPDIELEIKRNGEWEHWATASWKSGSFTTTLADESTQTDRVVAVPEDTECIRTIVKNENTATEGKTITQAAIDYDVRVVVGLRTTDSMIDKINDAFASSKTPKFYVYNRANLTAVKGEDTDKLIDLGTENYSPNSANNRDGYDLIAGYSEDVKVIPSKQSSFDPEMDWNTGDNKVIIHYSAKVEERTYINSKAAYEEALETGTIDGETHAIWRDLLPEGVSPVLGTIKLREDDSIADIKTIPDYKGSGRTLLIVEADLTPHPTTYKENNITYFMDAPSISFEGEIYLNGVRNGYLDDPIHNVISFESDNDTLGTVTGYMGEPDDPRSNNNDITRIAFASDKEKDAMTDLDPDRDTPSFVYAGCNTTIDLPGAAITGLDKKVMVNNDENWSTGIYGKNPDGNRRDVYAGGPYSYRLSYMPQAENTRVKDIIFFDSLENYYPSGDDEDSDEEFRFKGTLRSVDVRYLKNKGCDPVIYYYTGEEALDLTEGYIEGENLGNMDLESDIWVKAADYDGPLNAVKAVAIDASKDKDGNDFVLDADENVYAIINMTAPTIDENGNLRDSYGENFEDEPHAYNDVYCLGTTEDTATGQTSRGLMHNSYTKVGIKSYDLSIEKYWDDDNDRDGLRTENVTIDLMADGEKVDEVTLPDPRGYMDHTFENLPYMDEDGNVIHYTFKEENIPEGYTARIQCSDNRYVLINKHVPEKITIEGEKKWVGDTEGSRPESIKINLYADGEKIQQKTVSPNSSGMWTYSFTDLNKYADGGNEIEYTVDEEMEGKLASYEGDIDGYDITNTYHPYGDLKVSKTVSQVTPQAEDKTFTFGFEFTRTETDENEVVSTVPTGKAFEYDVLDKEDNVIDGLSGYISTGQTIEIKGGQSILIKEVDEDINYRIYEEDTAGFEHVTASDVKGKIKPNKTEEVGFINKYNTEGSVEFKARKELIGHELYRYKFHYKVFLLEEDSNGKIRETLIRTASNDSPDEVTTEDGVMTSSAPINLCTLRYGIHDNDMTYTYRIEETIGRGNREDEERAVNEDGVSYADATPEERAAGGFKLYGYIYDTTSYYVTVDVTDNGDGTMTCDMTYLDKDSEPLGEDEVPLFENSYEAEGYLPVRAWKDLKGRNLEREEFEFELNGPYVVNDQGDVDLLESDELPKYTKNGLKGDNNVVNFKSLHFDQSDIGKTYYYTVKEVIPSGEDADPTVIYDKKVYGYKVTVIDNNDGTLSFEQVPAIPVDENKEQVEQNEDGSVTIAGWAEENADIPVFTNTLKPGKLSVSKFVTNPEEADPDQEFHFHVRLIGEDAEDASYSYDIEQIEGEEPGPGGEPGPAEPRPGEQAKEDGTKETEQAKEATEDAKEADQKIAEEDTRETYEEAAEEQAVSEKSTSKESPAMDGEPGVVSHTPNGGNILTKIADVFTSLFADKAYGADIEGKLVASGTYDGLSYKIVRTEAENPEDVECYLMLGTENSTEILTYRDYRNSSYWPWFRYREQITKVLFVGEVAGRGSLEGMFYYLSNVDEFENISYLNTSGATSMNKMFMGCISLTSFDLSSFNTGNVESAEGMFSTCTNLISLDLTNFTGEKLTNTSNMFYECSSLTGVSFPNFSAGNVTNMSRMFARCTSLTNVDLSSLKTESLTSTSYMFVECSSLTNINLSNFITKNVTDMSGMFSKCSSLTELDLSGFDTSNVTDMAAMFSGCGSLTNLNVTSFNTENSKHFNGMFSGCSGLTSLDVSGFVTSDSTERLDLVNMFQGCSRLKELDLSNFHTAGAFCVEGMFEGCSSLETLDIRNMSTASLFDHRELDGAYLDTDIFKGTTNLKKIVLGPDFGLRWRPTNHEHDSLVVLEPPSSNSPYTGKWIREDGAYGPYTSQELLEEYSTNGAALAGTWVWEDNTHYTLSFKAEDGAEAVGSMPNVRVRSDEDYTLPKNKFRWFGHEFVNWTDEFGNEYDDLATIPKDTYEGGATITLTAHFQPKDMPEIEVTNGEFDFYLHDKEKATFVDIPAGTAYQVWEETPDGWVLVQQVNASGEITSLGTASAKFWNQYQPEITTVQLSGAKQLDGAAAEAGMFSFELNEPGNESGTITLLGKDGTFNEADLPIRTSTRNGGFIQFPIVKYTADDVGTHTYTITEVDPCSNEIEYDKHTETVTVEVTQNDDGSLSSVTTYDEDGIRFYNKTRPGTLMINKSAKTTEQNKDDVFTFKVTLHNENGQPIGDDEGIYWYTEKNNNDDGPIIGPIGPKDEGIGKKIAAKASEVVDDIKEWASETWEDIKAVFSEPVVDTAYGAEGDYVTGGTYDNVSWRLVQTATQGEYELIIGRAGVTQTYTNNMSRIYNSWPWYNGYNRQITKVRFAGTVIGQGSLSYMFYLFEKLTEIDLSGLDTVNVTKMSGMFSNCYKLVELNLSSFDTANVTDMSRMFGDCYSLKKLDISSFNTSKVTSMGEMFSSCRSITDLDVSHFNTSNVTAMYGMFQGCPFSKIDVSSFDTRKVNNMNAMFNGCAYLTTLDCSNFDTSLVKRMGSMFAQCKSLESLDISSFSTESLVLGYNTNQYYENRLFFANGTTNLKRVVLGPDFGRRWKPNSSAYYSDVQLCTPSSADPYTGKWIREDGSLGPYTSTELMLNYNSSYAGTWVWEVGDDRGQIWFDANGGYTSETYVTATSADQEITMPGLNNTYFPKHILTGWNTEPDGTGRSFAAGETYNDVVELGRTITLYAQWEDTDMCIYKVQHYQQNTNLEGYSLAETERFMADSGTSVTPEVKTYDGFFKPDPQTITVKDDDSSEVKYYYDRMSYKVYFDGNGATYGSMDPVEMLGGVSKKLPENTYQKIGSIFTGWADDEGTIYTNGQSVVNLSKDGGDVTLHAQWMDNPNEPLTPTNGEIIVQCKAGETIVIPNLPAGTTYTVEEIDLPEGWDLGRSSGTRGNIRSNGTSEANFGNIYRATGEVQLEATKIFQGGTLTRGQFAFGVYDPKGRLISTGHNDENGRIVFDPISIQGVGGEYTYYIREIIPDEASDEIIYDWHEEKVIITAEDAGHGKLTTTVTYDEDGAVFTNTMAPGEILITKDVTEGSPLGQKFDFKVELFDENGNEYIVTDEDGNKENTFGWELRRRLNQKPYAVGKAGSGDVLNMFSGQYLIIFGVPGGYTYRITEMEKPNWKAVGDDVVEGTVISNERVFAAFTNEYTNKNEVIFEADKELKGKKLTEGMFNFGIFDEDGNQVSSGTNDDKGHIVFDAIGYDGDDFGKTYNYTIREIEGNTEGMTYDDTSFDVSVSVDLDDNGILSATKGGDFENIKFTNTYEADGSITFHGTKTLTGRQMAADDVYAFEIIDEEGNVKRCTNDADGSINYPAINFTEEDAGKTFTYTVKESAFNSGGVTSDNTEYTVKVTVTDNGNGTLDVKMAEGSDDLNALNFVNTYQANGEITFAGTKHIDTRALLEGEKYDFGIYDEAGELVSTASNDQNGAIVFKPLKFTKDDEGEHVYTVKEISEGGNGITPDDTVYTVTVNVEHKGNGVLDVTAETDKDGVDYQHLDFTNKYKATGSSSFEGTVTIDGRDLTEDDEFTFTITDGENTWTATNDAEGNINYPEIEYTIDDVGEHTYTITQTTTDGNGLVIDTTTYTVTVIVKDNGDGTLSIEYAGDDHMELDFVNKYEATAEYTIGGTKHLDGLDLEKDQFTFELRDGKGKLLETARNDEDGNFTFETIEFTLDYVGTVNYTVSEKDEGEEGFTYDDTEYEVTLEISDNGDGTLKVVPEKDVEIEFHNTFEFTPVISDPPVKKIVKGNPDADDTFTFQMKAKTKGAPMPEGSKDGVKIVTIKGAGEYEFGEMEYYEPGKWVYEISEVDGGLDNYTYDRTRYTLTVEVTQDGTELVKEETVKGGDGEIVFTNIYDEEKPGPKTGDTTEFMPYIMAMAASGLALLVLLLKRRKKSKHKAQ